MTLETETCNCGGYLSHKFCKHIIAWKLDKEIVEASVSENFEEIVLEEARVLLAEPLN